MKRDPFIVDRVCITGGLDNNLLMTVILTSALLREGAVSHHLAAEIERKFTGLAACGDFRLCLNSIN